MFNRFTGPPTLPLPGEKPKQASTWPPAAVLIPGRSVTFEFCTVSDYNERKRSDLQWGFRCVVKGFLHHSDLPMSWLSDTERAVGYLCALSAGTLIAGSGYEPTPDELELKYVSSLLLSTCKFKSVDGTMSSYGLLACCVYHLH